MFKLEFATDNAAFESAPESEVARILREIADRIEGAGSARGLTIGGKVADENGNTVGKWSLAVEESEG